MVDRTTLRISVPSLWDLVRDVRASVGERLKDDDPELRDAAVMTASELVENAIKYGQSVTGRETATLEMSRDDKALTIRISSGVRDQKVAEKTLDRIRAIRAAPDKQALYIARLRELMASPAPQSQLGLYRICSEGAFELDAVVEGDVLHITATRGVSP